MRDSTAIWYPSPNFNSRYGNTVRWLIIHATAGGGAENWFRDPQNTDSSAHYVIKVNGTLYQCVDESDMAWSNGPVRDGAAYWWLGTNPNYKTISIEFEKLDIYNNSIITDAQKSTGFALIDRLTKRNNIPRRLADANGGITGHFSMDPVNRQDCPGVFPWDEMFTYLSGGAQNNTAGDLVMLEIGQGMGRYFTDKGNGRWHCNASNVDLIGANLAFYRKYEGVWGLPLSNEVYLSQLPGTAIVVCESGIQIYDPAHKFGKRGDDPCYLMLLNQGVGRDIVAKPLIEALNTKISQLEAQLAKLQQELAAHSDTQELEKELAAAKQALQLVWTTVLPYNSK